MKKIIDSIVQLTNQDKRLVTISEVTHRSYSSHTFHYNLVKALHQSGKVRLFASERLGVLDALLINLWLQNKLTMSLKELYDEYLPFGGLGTYRWVKYFKTQDPKTFRLVGADSTPQWALDNNNKKLLALLKQLASPQFGNQLNNTFAKIPEKKYIQNNVDKVIYQALREANHERLDPNARGKIWARNINQLLEKNPEDKLFINGFHLSRHQSGYLKKIRLPKSEMLVLGMASISREIPVVPLNRKWFEKQKLPYPPDFNSQQFWQQYYDYYDTLTEKEQKKYLNNVKHSSEVVSPTPFESTCGRRFSIRRTQNLRDEYIDHGMGGIAEPYVKNHIRRHTGGFDVADYDFVICIPHSSYRKDMRY